MTTGDLIFFRLALGLSIPFMLAGIHFFATH